MQICILMSELGRNEDALQYSKRASEGCLFIFL